MLFPRAGFIVIKKNVGNHETTQTKRKKEHPEKVVPFKEKFKLRWRRREDNRDGSALSGTASAQMNAVTEANTTMKEGSM